MPEQVGITCQIRGAPHGSGLKEPHQQGAC
jgi:hypothetical protein